MQKYLTKRVELPEDIKKEILILYELGLEEYEIDYILHLKAKERLRTKWDY